jgi:hypothetical protein
MPPDDWDVAAAIHARFVAAAVDLSAEDLAPIRAMWRAIVTSSCPG